MAKFETTIIVSHFNVSIEDLKPGWYMNITRSGELLGIGAKDGFQWTGVSFLEKTPKDKAFLKKVLRRIPAAIAEITKRLDEAGIGHNLGA